MTYDFDSLRDAERLRALRETGLLDTPPEPAFDRLTRLASRIFGAPLSVVNLLDDRRQFTKSCFAPAWWPAERESALEDSFCRHVVASREPLLVEDAPRDPRVASSSFVAELGLRSYLGVPLTTSEGQILGALYVADFEARRWTPEQTEILVGLAESVVTEIELRREIGERMRTLGKLQASEGLERAAHRELQVVHRRVEDVLESIADPFFAFDGEWRFTFLNRQAEALVGRSRDELLGTVAWKEFPWLEGSPLYDACHRAMVERATVDVVVESRISPGVWYDMHIVPTGEGIAVYARDITARKEAEQALAESMERFQALTEHSSDLVTLMGADGTIRYQSASAERLFGYGKGELVGRRVFDLVHPDDVATVRASFEDFVRKPDTVHRIEFRFPHRDGSWRLVEARGSNRLDDPAVRGLIVTTRDMTDRKREEEELRAARDAADAANRSKSELLSRMSHELRTPLNAILGFGQLLEMDIAREEDRESIQQILRAGRHLLALIDEVLDIAAIEAGRLSLAVEPVLVKEVVEESLDLVRHIARQEEVELRFEAGTGPEEMVWADEQRLKQVMLNLLSNAIKYNRRNGRVAVLWRPEGNDRLRIEVRDTGHGIPADALDRVFAPFDRLDAGQRGIEGTGLGLALAKALLEAMGGAIGVQSEEGVGSTFWVVLPRPRSHDAPRAPAPAREGTAATRTVLLVEDNLANARLIAHVLHRRPQVRLLTAVQGTMALELAIAQRPDLVLLDLNLPDIPGTEVLRRMQDDPVLRHIPVVTMSGGAAAPEVEETLRMGARSFLTKPFELLDLLRVVDDNLNDPRGPDTGEYEPG